MKKNPLSTNAEHIFFQLENNRKKGCFQNKFNLKQMPSISLSFLPDTKILVLKISKNWIKKQSSPNEDAK